MIGYVTLGTDNLERARAYFDPLFASVGAKRILQFPDEEGSFTMYGTSFVKPAVVITSTYDKAPADCGNGNMVALVFDAPAKVDAFHAKALELGGSDDGPPGFRGDPAQGYYFGYFRDPDGHKFAAYCITTL